MAYTVDNNTGIQALDHNCIVKRNQGWAVYNPASGNCKVTINTGELGPGKDTLTVQPGDVLIDGTDTTVSETVVTIPQPGESPRKDVIAINSSGEVVREPGTPESLVPSTSTLKISERPAPPDLADTDAVPLAVVLVHGGATTITSDNLVDIRSDADYTAGTINGDDPTRYTQADADETITGDWSFDGQISGTNLSGLDVNTDKDWGGYSIINPGTVDGVDISALQSSYSSHSNNTSNPHNVGLERARSSGGNFAGPVSFDDVFTLDSVEGDSKQDFVLRANGVDLLRQPESGPTQMIQGADIGPTEAPPDSLTQLINASSTSSAASGDKVGYTFALNSQTVVSVEGAADGSGGVSEITFSFHSENGKVAEIDNSGNLNIAGTITENSSL